MSDSEEEIRRAIRKLWGKEECAGDIAPSITEIPIDPWRFEDGPARRPSGGPFEHGGNPTFGPLMKKSTTPSGSLPLYIDPALPMPDTPQPGSPNGM